MSETTKGKVKNIIMDKSAAPSDNITLGPELSYDATNAQVAVDAINSSFGTNVTVEQFLSFQTIGEVGDYVASLVHN
jgi:acyl carrier protein